MHVTEDEIMLKDALWQNRSMPLKLPPSIYMSFVTPWGVSNLESLSHRFKVRFV